MHGASKYQYKKQVNWFPTDRVFTYLFISKISTTAFPSRKANNIAARITQHHEFATTLLRPAAPAGLRCPTAGRPSPGWVPVAEPGCAVRAVPTPGPGSGPGSAGTGTVPATAVLRLPSSSGRATCGPIPVSPSRPGWPAGAVPQPIVPAAPERAIRTATSSAECSVWPTAASGPECPLRTAAPSQCSLRAAASVWPATGGLRRPAAPPLSRKLPFNTSCR